MLEKMTFVCDKTFIASIYMSAAKIILVASILFHDKKLFGSLMPAKVSVKLFYLCKYLFKKVVVFIRNICVANIDKIIILSQNKENARTHLYL